ncbi:MAG: WYL domain-containing protein [Flavobacterium sp. BFFFF2]|nr:MAG: WYL domain-containing protein [Flavobacterium sp. BFFFF2]
MSINKNAYLRYQVLDKCFCNKYKIYFIEDLLNEVNKSLEDFNGSGSKIEKRQLFDDIKFMESEAGWSIPLERIKEGKRVKYRYSEDNFSIKNQKISDEELDAINAALMVFMRFKGLPQFEWINELVPKLQSVFQQDETIEVISFDQNEFLVGLEHLPMLYKSIIKETVLAIEYQSFKDRNSKLLKVHPYYLKQFNKRWFLFGLNNTDKLLYNLPLDRIKSIKPDHMKFMKNSVINFKEYFEDIVGVSFQANSKPIKIRIHLDNEIAPYVLTKPLHGSQKKIESNDEGFVIQLEVIPNHELKQLLLSFGDGLEVVSPESYRDEISRTIKKMKMKYDNVC